MFNSPEEMASIVEAYINHRTDKQVRINIQGCYSDPQEMTLLIKAYNYAMEWFNSNNGQIIMTNYNGF